MKMMHQKLGLEKTTDSSVDLISGLVNTLQLSETDMTIFFRNLANLTKELTVTDPNDYIEIVKDAFYQPAEIKGEILKEWENWFIQYHNLLQEEERTNEQRKEAMNKVNPKYVLRNYMAQLAIDAADRGDYALVDEIHELLKAPYAEQPESEKWFAKRPEWARHKVGCSMLSCSS